jgi:DNA-binding transcriptional regulator LsrR (DeoR family)
MVLLSVAFFVDDLAEGFTRLPAAGAGSAGLGWGRSVHRVVHNRFFREKRGVTVVQLMGSIGGSIPEFDGIP